MADQFSLPKVIMPISEQRIKKAITAIKQVTDKSDWIKILKQVPQNDFNLGDNDRQWKANFDWLFRNENYLKLLEAYENENS